MLQVSGRCGLTLGSVSRGAQNRKKYVTLTPIHLYHADLYPVVREIVTPGLFSTTYHITADVMMNATLRGMPGILAPMQRSMNLVVRCSLI